MIKVLFVCHGNICRSPMAEFIMKDKINKLLIRDKFIVDSRATSTEEIGNGIFPEAVRTLKKHNILNARHAAKQITIGDYIEYDYIFVMDYNNIRMLKYVLNLDSLDKVQLIGEFIEQNLIIEDPWYTGNFELVYNQLDTAINIFIEKLKKEGII